MIGGRDHTTVCHSKKIVENAFETNYTPIVDLYNSVMQNLSFAATVVKTDRTRLRNILNMERLKCLNIEEKRPNAIYSNPNFQTA
jgi:hypothetical protein